MNPADIPSDIPFRNLEDFIITKIFSFIDLDNDNSLTFIEIRRFFEQFDLLEIYNSSIIAHWRSNFPNGMDVKSFIRFIRHINRSDACNPRFVILIKFLHFLAPVDNPSDRMRHHLIIDNLFSLFDVNDDKSMSREEFIAIWTPSLGISLEEFLIVFEACAQSRLTQADTLPPGWTMQMDKTHGPYYENTQTGSRRWNRPVELPPGWTELFDETTRNHYYRNSATGQTQWEPPPMVTYYLDSDGFRAVIDLCQMNFPNILEKLRSQYYAAALLKLGPFKDIITRLFQFLDKDKSQTLDRHEVSQLFSTLPHVNYSQELFDTYDTNRDGSLSLEEFTNLCVELNAHFTRNGDNRFIMYCVSISEGKTPVISARSEPFSDFRRVDVVGIRDLPHSALQIPRTKYTYGQLLDAMQDKRCLNPEARLRGFGGCDGIHQAARNMLNPRLVEDILIENALANCGVRREQLANVGSQQEQDVLLQKLLDLLLRIARENKKDSPAEIDYLQWLVKAIKTDMTSTAPRFGFTYSRYHNLLITVCFLECLSKSAQQIFFNYFLEDNREAYSSDPTGRAVCPPGVMERTLMYFRDIISLASTEQTRIQGASAPAPGPVQFGPGYGRDLHPSASAASAALVNQHYVDQEPMLTRWFQLYTEHSHPDKETLGSKFYFKCYIFEKIVQLTPPNNDPEDWIEAVDTFLASAGISMSFDGGYNFMKKKSQTKRKNARKSKIQYNRSKTHNKRRFRK